MGRGRWQARLLRPFEDMQTFEVPDMQRDRSRSVLVSSEQVHNVQTIWTSTLLARIPSKPSIQKLHALQHFISIPHWRWPRKTQAPPKSRLDYPTESQAQHPSPRGHGMVNYGQLRHLVKSGTFTIRLCLTPILSQPSLPFCTGQKGLQCLCPS